MQSQRNGKQLSMFSKKETIVLILTLLITAGLIGVGVWWFTRQSGVKLGNLQPNQSNQPTQSTAETFAQVQDVPKGLFNYGGSTSWAPIRKEVDPVIQSIWPQFQLRYTDPWKNTPSSYTGISMLLYNQLAFAHSSRAASNDEHEYAQKRGFRLKEIPVAIDGFAVIVHPSLNIPGLTVAQFDDVVAGKITSWREVGGPNRKIQLYGKQDRESGDRFKLTRTTTEAVRLVATDPGGIYWASASLLVGQCLVKPLPIGRNSNQLIPPYKLPYVTPDKCPQQRNQVNLDAFRSGEYPLSRRLVVVVKQNGEIDQQAGEAYANLLLTSQGQELIEKAGFVRIR
jgi:phosphate transport system substrate-binding protein